LPVSDGPQIGLLGLGGGGAFGLALMDLEVLVARQALALAARRAKEEFEPAEFLAIERGSHERVLLAAAEQVPRDYDELAGSRDGCDLRSPAGSQASVEPVQWTRGPGWRARPLRRAAHGLRRRPAC